MKQIGLALFKMEAVDIFFQYVNLKYRNKGGSTLTLASTRERPKTDEKEDKEMPKISIYLAGPLFGIADRHHNLLLARELELLGYVVILPQKEALKFFNGKTFDLEAISESCLRDAVNSDVVVANIDGPSADDGTSMEVGMAILHKRNSFAPANWPLVICVRTDFRTAIDREVGINGMFRLADKTIYKPSFINSFEEAANFYRELAREIDNVIIEKRIKR